MEFSYRLPTHIRPTKYDLTICPIGPSSGIADRRTLSGPAYDKLKGRCMINFKIDSETSVGLPNEIILNGYDIDVRNVSLVGNKSVHTHISTIYDTKLEQIKFVFDTIPDKSGVLTIEYEALIRTDPIGFYKCEDNGKLIFLTQSQPIAARKWFPCFDEPNFKAEFSLRVVVPTDSFPIVLANMSVKNVMRTAHTITHVFHSTPLMSTYLVAVYIGHGAYVEGKTNDQVAVKVFSYEADKKETTLALDTAIKCMNYMVDFFGIEYPLDKLDLISVPNFAAGAMENWGLVIFRTDCLLTNLTMTTDDRIELVYTICHELAHQWFGNLVTIDWWSDLWLNESFATWLGWHVVSVLYPEWNIDGIFFEKNYLLAFKADSVRTSRPICFDVTTPSIIMQIFDSITYQKGASVIKMLVNFIGFDTFKRSIREYIQTYAYKNTQTANLWKCMENKTTYDIGLLMHNWIHKQNYPLVSIYPYYDDHLEIVQDPCVYGICTDNPMWIIPLSDGIVLDRKKAIVTKPHFITKINSNAMGFYKVFYHPNLLRQLVYGQKKLSELDVASLLTNYYDFLKMGKISYENYLESVAQILDVGIVSDLILKICTSTYDDFKMIIHRTFTRSWDSDAVNMQNDYILRSYGNILKKYIKHIDIKLNMTESRKKILYELTYSLGLEPSVRHFMDLWKKIVLTKNFASIDNIFLVQTLVCGIEHADGFDFLLRILQANQHKLYEEIVLSAMAMTPDERSYGQFLDLFKSQAIQAQTQGEIFTMARLNRNLNWMLWPYVRTNWDLIVKKFSTTQFVLTRIMASMKNLIGTPELVNEMRAFFDPKEKYNMELSYRNMLESIQINWEIRQRIMKD